MASVACKLVRLEVTSYEMGEATNRREKGRGSNAKKRSTREGETRGAKLAFRETLLCLQTKYAAYAFVRFVNAT